MSFVISFAWISHIYCVCHQHVHLLLIHSGLGLVAFGLSLIALGLGLDLVASYTSGFINIPALIRKYQGIFLVI